MAGFSSRYQRYLDMPENKFERAIKDLSPSELEGLQKALAAKQQRISDESWAVEVWLWAAVIFVATIFLIVTAASALADPSTIEGTVERWRDGDTPVLLVDGKLMPVRLHGLHAPEDGEPGYAEATAFMVELVGAQPLSCKLTGRMTWDRHEGTCWLGDLDIAAELIRAGLGRDCPYHSDGAYRHLETDAGRELRLPRYCVPKN